MVTLGHTALGHLERRALHALRRAARRRAARRAAAPGRADRHGHHRRRLRRRRGRRAARPRARRPRRATTTALVGAVGHDFYDGRARGGARASRASPTRACAAPTATPTTCGWRPSAVARALRRRRASTCCCCTTPTAPATRARRSGRRWRRCATTGLTGAIGVAPGPANGFTLDLIDCFERFGELIDWAMVILNPLEPWPGELVLPAAAQPRRKLITRVVDYGGLFWDDVPPGHALAPRDHRALPPRRLGRGRPRADRADAPDRRAPRAHDAPARLPVEPRARAGRAASRRR